MARLLWLVDDTPRWHAVTERCLDQCPGWRFTGFHTGAAAMHAFALQADTDPSGLPTVVLMDFFLGATRGDHVTAELRTLEPAGHHCTIVGHSTSLSGSEAIIAAGADLALPKYADDRDLNPDLMAWLRSWPDPAQP